MRERDHSASPTFSMTVLVRFLACYLPALTLATMTFSSCLTAELENQEAIIRDQRAEIARQRKEIEILKNSQQTQEKRLRDCNRAFREYFDRAQLTADGNHAVEIYREGLALCPEDDVAHYELGRLLAAQGHYSEAEKELQSALKINPDFAEAKARLQAIRKNQ